MITIIFGAPGQGKTGLLTFILNERIYDKERNGAMQAEIEELNANGFKLSIPEHCVYSNYTINCRKWRWYDRTPWIINPFRLGLQKDSPVKCHYILPHGTIGIDEAQKHFYSKGGSALPVWVSNFFEEHRHHDLDIYLAAQRPFLIEKNIRDISQGYDVVLRTIKKKRKGGISITWTVNVVNVGDIDRYVNAETEADKRQFYHVEQFTADYNIYDLYDSQGCKYRFFEGHMTEDFDLREAAPLPSTFEEYQTYMDTVDDERPAEYTAKKKDKNNGT